MLRGKISTGGRSIRLSLILTFLLAMLIGGAQAVFAATPVEYLDSKGESKTVSTDQQVTPQTTTLTDGWWVVNTNVIVNDRIQVNGDVHLVLQNGKTLSTQNASDSESALSGIRVPAGNSLTIYAQSTDESVMGVLHAEQEDWTRNSNVSLDPRSANALIGGDANEGSGEITINGGKIEAIKQANIGGTQGGKGSYGAAIGAGMNATSCGKITINGGVVSSALYGFINGMCGANIGSSTAIAANSIGPIEINGGKIDLINQSGPGLGLQSTGGGARVDVKISGGEIKTNCRGGAVRGGILDLEMTGGKLETIKAGSSGPFGVTSGDIRVVSAEGPSTISLLGGKIDIQGDIGMSTSNGYEQVTLNLGYGSARDYIKRTNPSSVVDVGTVNLVNQFYYNKDDNRQLLPKGKVTDETVLQDIKSTTLYPYLTVSIKDNEGNIITGTTVEKTAATYAFKISAEADTEDVQFEFNSSDTDVAEITLNGGTITILKTGTSTITATALVDGTPVATEGFTLKVNKSNQALTISELGSTIPVGASLTKYATQNPFSLQAVNSRDDGGDITWKSSDPSVAQIDETTGLVTLKKHGKTTITATANATDRYNQAETSFELNVNQAETTLDWIYSSFMNTTKDNPYVLDLWTSSDFTMDYPLVLKGKDAGGNFQVIYREDLNTRLTGSHDSEGWLGDFEPANDRRFTLMTEILKANSHKDTDPHIVKVTIRFPGDDLYAPAEAVIYQKHLKAYQELDSLCYDKDGNAFPYVSQGHVSLSALRDPEDVIDIYPRIKKGDGSFVYKSKDESIITVENKGDHCSASVRGKGGGCHVLVHLTETDLFEAFDVDAVGVAFEVERATPNLSIGELPEMSITDKPIRIPVEYDGDGKVTTTVEYFTWEEVEEEVDGELQKKWKLNYKSEETDTLDPDKYAPNTWVFIEAVSSGTDKYKSVKTEKEFRTKKASHTLSFENVENGELVKTYGDEDFTTAAKTDMPEYAERPGSNFKINYTSSDESVATVDSTGTVSIRKPGRTVITALSPASRFMESAEASYELEVKKMTPTLTLVDENNEAIGNTIEKMTSDPSFVITGKLNVQDGSPIRYDSSDEDVAYYRKDGRIVIQGEGETTMTATAAATEKYEEANATFTLKVEKAEPEELKEQILTFEDIEGGSLTKKENAPDFTTVATSTGDGDITYYSDDETVASISNSGKVHIEGAGQTTIRARASSTAVYRGAKAAYTLIVDPVQLNEQVIAFENVEGNRLVKKITDDNFSTPAKSSQEGAQITYRSSNEKVAMIEQDGTVHIQAVGETTITATAAAIGEYAEAATEYKLIVGKGELQVVFNKIAEDTLKKTVGDAAFDSSAKAIASDKLLYDGKITYRSADENVAVIDINTGEVTILGEGRTTITAEAEETDYFETAAASYELTVEAKPAPHVHKYGAWTKLNASQHQRVCEYDEAHVEKANHEWDAGKVTKKATTAATGVKTYTCTICKGTKTETIPKLVDPAKQYGTDGTPAGPGANIKAAEKAITQNASDKSVKGSKFAPLKLRSTSQGKTSIKLTWTKNKEAVKYVVYGNQCNAKGKKYKTVKLATVNGGSYNVKKINKAKVKKGTYYKFVLVAINKSNKVVSTSKMIHVATKGGKVGNVKSVTVKAKINAKGKATKKAQTLSKTVLKKGKSLKVTVSQSRASKKLKVGKHEGPRYESSNTRIATVSGKGVIKAKNKGTATIYVYAQNGVAKAVKITVK